MVNGCGGWRGRQEAAFIISPLIYFTTELIKKKRAAYPGREGDARDEKVILEKRARRTKNHPSSFLPFFLCFFFFREIGNSSLRSPFVPLTQLWNAESMLGETFFFIQIIRRVYFYFHLFFFFLFSRYLVN